MMHSLRILGWLHVAINLMHILLRRMYRVRGRMRSVASIVDSSSVNIDLGLTRWSALLIT